MRLPGLRPATDEMNTTDDDAPSAADRASSGNAAWHVRKCARALTAKVASHCAGDVCKMPEPRPTPTLSPRPSTPPRDSLASATALAHSDSSLTSAVIAMPTPP